MKPKNAVVLALSLIIFGLYCWSMYIAFPLYSATSNTNPFAMIESLPLQYYFALILLVLLCFACVFYNVKEKYIHIALLVQLALILWFTPFYLSGFSYINDSLMHVGVSHNIPEVLRGTSSIEAITYGDEYPISFIYNYMLMSMSGIDSFIYSRIVYPVFASIALVFLWYVFFSRFFDSKVAFLSVVIAALSLGSVPQVYVSPNSLATIILLTVLTLLLTQRDIKSTMLGFLLSFILILTHAVSPVILVLFLLALQTCTFITRSRKSYSLAYGTFALIIGWFAWTFYHCSKTAVLVASAIYKVFTLKFSNEFGEIVSRLTSTTHSIFPAINIATKALYYGVIVIAVIFVCLSLININTQTGIRRFLTKFLTRIHFQEFLFLALAFLFFSFSFILAFSGIGGWGFYVRSYFFFIFTISAYIAFNFLNGKSRLARLRKCIKIAVVFWFSFAALIYPFVSYAVASYSSYPPSEGRGLEFLSSHATLNQKSISMYLPVHLLSYVSPETEFVSHPFNMSDLMSSIGNPISDIIVFRRSMYFNIVLEYDFNLSDNSYARVINKIDNRSCVNKVYSNPSFEIYVSNTNHK